MATDDCSRFAIHDLAALAEGNLSPDGTRRLAGHIRECTACMATLAAIVDDTQSTRGTGDQCLAAWLATAIARDDLPSGGASSDDADAEPRALHPAPSKFS